MPVLGLGTWRSQPGEVEKAVEIALKAGYRHIDTATGYSNEKEVGEGIKASGVPREEIFLTTKLNTIDMNPNDVQAALEYSVKQLDTYLDLWLVHWPAPMTKDFKAEKSLDWLDTWHAVEKVYLNNKDKVRAIGISNWSVKYLERLLSDTTVIPAVNQIELHPSCTQTELVDFCRSKGITLTAYSALGSQGSPLLTNPVVTKIAKKNGVTPPNVLLSLWANQKLVTVLAKSVTAERIVANLRIINLTSEEVEELLAIDKTEHFRVCGPQWTGWGGLGFPDCE